MMSNILSNTFGNLLTTLGIVILAALIIVAGVFAACIVRLVWTSCSDVISNTRTNKNTSEVNKHE